MLELKRWRMWIHCQHLQKLRKPQDSKGMLVISSAQGQVAVLFCSLMKVRLSLTIEQECLHPLPFFLCYCSLTVPRWTSLSSPGMVFWIFYSVIEVAVKQFLQLFLPNLQLRLLLSCFFSFSFLWWHDFSCLFILLS